jgi:hypothetical protein
VQSAGQPNRQFAPVSFLLIEFRVSDGIVVSGAREPADTRVVWRGSHTVFLIPFSASW